MVPKPYGASSSTASSIYAEAEEDVSTVHSCEICDFTEGLVTRITSFNVEV